jgi:hypothetical protein
MHQSFSIKQVFYRHFSLIFRYFKDDISYSQINEKHRGKQAHANTVRLNFSNYYTRIVLKIKPCYVYIYKYIQEVTYAHMYICKF